MSAAHFHDPVNALAEADATGRVAEIFAEIRHVLQIPLLGSIWRSLAGIENGLEAVWAAARPIYESGQPHAILQEMRRQVTFPVPQMSSIEVWQLAKVGPQDRAIILSTIEAYNRSNGLNLLALTALMRRPAEQARSYTIPPSPGPWPTPPRLLGKDEIDSAGWRLLEAITAIGASHDNPGMPTLWRHLIHWPGLIQQILESYELLHQDGTLNRAIEEVRVFVESEAPSLSHFKKSTSAIPGAALSMIDGYVGKPPSVSRMTTFGHSVSAWLTEEA